MFSRKKVGNQGLVLSEVYVPGTLPQYGQKLDTFIPSSYTMTIPERIQEYYERLSDKLRKLIDTCDQFTDGSVFDTAVDVQVDQLQCRHATEVVSHQLQCKNIVNARNNRKGQLERKKTDLEEKTQGLRQKIAPLADLHAQFEMKLGPVCISYGLIATILALVVDSLVNYSYLQAILLQNRNLLIVCTVCLAFMSDVSMFCLGSFLSRKEENFMSTWLYRVVTVGMLSLFMISAVTGIMVRFGSMDQTFGTINAAGEFVGKSRYSPAEYGVAMATAFLTTATGLISFALSVDKNSHLVKRRGAYEEELSALEAELCAVNAELSALDGAMDPYELDKHYRAAAEESIEALRAGLKIHIRKLLSEKMEDPTFTEQISQSCDVVLEKKSHVVLADEKERND